MFQKFVDNYSCANICNDQRDDSTRRAKYTQNTQNYHFITDCVCVLSAYISIYFTPQRPVLYDMSQKYSVIIIDAKIPIFEQQLQRL